MKYKIIYFADIYFANYNDIRAYDRIFFCGVSAQFGDRAMTTIRIEVEVYQPWEG